MPEEVAETGRCLSRLCLERCALELPVEASDLELPRLDALLGLLVGLPEQLSVDLVPRIELRQRCPERRTDSGTGRPWKHRHKEGRR